MTRAAFLVLALALPIAAQSSKPKVDPAKLERIRKMSPEERRRLLDRLEQYKKLSEEERERVQQNFTRFKELPPEVQKKLKEKVKNLSEEEQKFYREFAGAFFKTLQKRQKKELQAFPRMIFFAWLKNEKQDEIERMKSLEPVDRNRAFLELYLQFRVEVEKRTLIHARKHKCVPIEDVDALRDASPEDFWPKWRELTKRCQKPKK